MTGSVAQTDVDDVVRKGAPCAYLEESAECRWRHSCQVGHGAQANFFLEVFVDVFLHLAYAAAVGSRFHRSERRRRQQMEVIFERKLVEDVEQFEHTREPRCLGRKFVQFVEDAHDGRQAEAHPALGVFEKPSQRSHLAFRKERLAQQVG